MLIRTGKVDPASKTLKLKRLSRLVLAFSNYINEGNVLPALRKACEQSGILLDVLGESSGTAHAQPEELLEQYDIVFAKGRAALEAAAVGCAVIVCDAAGIGEMTSSAQLSHFRDFNFGLRLLRNNVTVEAVVNQIDRYDSSDTNAVTALVRADIGMDLVVDKLLAHYSGVIRFHDSDNHLCNEVIEQEAISVAAYLRHGPMHGDFFHGERVKFHQTLGSLQARAIDLQESARDLRSQLDRERNVLHSVRSQNESLQDEVRNLRSQLAMTIEESDKKLLEKNLMNQALNMRVKQMQDSFVWRLRSKLARIGRAK